MQDSIEDYIRISKNTKCDSANANINISKEVLATAQRKKECEEYAMKIVLFLIDGILQPEIFLKCLKYINEDYYQDIVEERSIAKLCGYPLCGEKIPEMPKQKYFISTKANKVYDISERKNYCSNFCYTSSVYVKNQIASSPLWLRNHGEMVDCKLWPATARGSPGEEIDQGLVKVPPEVPHFTSIVQFTQISLEEAEDIEKTTKKDKSVHFKQKKPKPQCSLNVIKEDSSESDSSEKSELYLNSDFDNNSDNEFENSARDVTSKTKRTVDINRQKLNKGKYEKEHPKREIIQNNDGVSKNKTFSTNSKVAKNIDEKEKLAYLVSRLKINNKPKTKLIDPPPMKIPLKTISEDNGHDGTASKRSVVKNTASKLPNKQSSTTKILKEGNKNSEMLNTVKAYVKEWITIDTFIYIYGEEKIKQALNENKMGEYFDKLKVTELETAQQLKYMNICKRLHMQEMAEEKFDNVVLGHSLKPLPDFKQLKEEVQEMNVKVKSFYSSGLYEKQDTNFPTIKEKEEEPTTVLPLVDVSAQNALRRKVFLNSVSKSLKKLIHEIKMDENYILSSVNDMVKTFKLEAHNTIFKPTALPLVAVILLKMLSIKDANIKASLEEEESVEHLDLILSSHFDGEKVVEDIVNILDDIDEFVVRHISSAR